MAQSLLDAFPIVSFVAAVFGSTPKFPLARTFGTDAFAFVPCFDRPTTYLFDLLQTWGGLPWPEARVRCPDLTDAELNHSAHLLVGAGFALIYEDHDLLVLTEYGEGVVATPFPALRHNIKSLKSDQFSRALTTFGLDVPGRKDDRVDEFISFLADPTAMREAVAERLPNGSQEILARLIKSYSEPFSVRYSDKPIPDPIHADTIAFYRNPPFDRRGDVYDGAIVSAHYLSDNPSVRYTHPLSASSEQQLADSLLVWSDYGARAFTPWAEVWDGFRNHEETPWRGAPTPQSRQADGEATSPMEVVQLAIDLLGHLRQRPAPGKKSGGREVPVTYWKSAAKAIGAPAETVVLIGSLLIRLGLILPVSTPATSRARNAKDTIEWRVYPPKAELFENADPALNWARLLDEWLPQDGHGLANSTGFARYLFLEILRQLESGAATGELLAYARDRHLHLGAADLDKIVQELAVLGVINVGSVIGLTPSARLVDEGVEALRQAQTAGDRTFIVQPDHSIIASANLAGDVSVGLSRIAERESSGGATVWKLSADRIEKAAASEGTASVIGFLSEHASLPVPEVVERFIVDSANRSASVTVRPAGTVITSADPATLAALTRHKAAKLEVVAPGVAVSPLDHHRVSTVLASKGVQLSDGRSGGDAGSEVAIKELVSSLANPWKVDFAPPSAPLPTPEHWFHLERSSSAAADQGSEGWDTSGREALRELLQMDLFADELDLDEGEWSP